MLAGCIERRHQPYVNVHRAKTFVFSTNSNIREDSPPKRNPVCMTRLSTSDIRVGNSYQGMWYRLVRTYLVACSSGEHRSCSATNTNIGMSIDIVYDISWAQYQPALQIYPPSTENRYESIGVPSTHMHTSTPTGLPRSTKHQRRVTLSLRRARQQTTGLPSWGKLLKTKGLPLCNWYLHTQQPYAINTHRQKRYFFL